MVLSRLFERLVHCGVSQIGVVEMNETVYTHQNNTLYSNNNAYLKKKAPPQARTARDAPLPARIKRGKLRQVLVVSAELSPTALTLSKPVP